MALQSSGAISINDIRNELGTSDGSLRNLSATAGFGTPDSMSEFYGYSNAPANIYLYQNDGGWYDGCRYVDHWGWMQATGYAGQYIGPWGDYMEYNTERPSGTFLTFGGNCYAKTKANNSVTIVFHVEPVHDWGCATGRCYIRDNGSTVVQQYWDSFNGNDLYYTFTPSAGSTHSISMGVF